MYFCRNPKLHMDEVDPEILVEEAYKFKVTRKMLKKLEDERQIEVTILTLISEVTPIDL